MDKYINQKILADLVSQKLNFIEESRISYKDNAKILSEIDGYEKAIKAIQELISDKDLIEDIPTSDVKPIRRGKWIHLKNYRDCEGDIYSQYKCSCCDFILGHVYDEINLTFFCGGCGADMRNKED